MDLNHLRDKFNSRKLAGLLWGFLILLGAYDVFILTPAIGAMYTTLVGGLCTLYGIYCGANFGDGWLDKKKATTETTVPPPVDPPATPPT
jgi:hypothetical protein